MRRVAIPLLFVALAAFAQEEAQDPITAAVERLKEAYGSESETDQVEAIRAAVGVVDPEVIKLVAKGLRSRSDDVAAAAIDALGRMMDLMALEELHRAYRRGGNLREDEELYALLIKSIGRHGNPGSLDVLGDLSFKHLTIASGRARIMALGNIRTEESVETFVSLARKAGGVSRRRGKVESGWHGKFRSYARVAMAVLTGQDFGLSAVDWGTWYRENRRNLEIAERRPEVSPEIAEFWGKFWGEPYYEGGQPPPTRELGAPYVVVQYPTQEQATEAAGELKKARLSRDDQLMIATIEDYAGVVHSDVIRELSKFLRYTAERVKIAAIDALGWTKHPDALKQLHRYYRRNKDLSKQEEIFAHTLKAIGRHGHKSSIQVLKDSPFKGLTLESGKARIMGLGNIRERDAVEELIKGMRLAGGNPRRSRRYGEPRFSEWFRIAMTVLTGEDHGFAKEDWEKWWRENKRTFRVDRRRPKIAGPMQQIWETYWSEPYYG
jgi:HEAT repeat protein